MKIPSLALVYSIDDRAVSSDVHSQWIGSAQVLNFYGFLIKSVVGMRIDSGWANSQRAGKLHKKVLAPLDGRSRNYEPSLWPLTALTTEPSRDGAGQNSGNANPERSLQNPGRSRP